MRSLQLTRFGISVAGVTLFVATAGAFIGEAVNLWSGWAGPLFGMFLLVAGAHWLLQRHHQGEF